MKKEELNEILQKHKLWLNNDKNGKIAILRGADLFGANLRGAILFGADLREAILRGADLFGADLFGVDLFGTDLRGVDLRGVTLDYSCLSLSCKSLTAQFDDKQLIQIAYHLCKAGLNSKNASDETKKELIKIVDFANKFHRVEECGKIEVKE